MNRKQRREAYARQLKAFGEWQKADPIAFERAYLQFNYIRSSVYFLFFAYVSQVVLARALSEPIPLVIQFAQSHPMSATIALILFGFLLYVFRERYRYYYGLTEMAFACALIYVGVNQLTETPSQLLTAVGGALYVLVRGLDNLIQGYKNPHTLNENKV